MDYSLWPVAIIDLCIHLPVAQREASYMLKEKQCTALPTKLHNLMECTVSMEAHSEQTCDNT